MGDKGVVYSFESAPLHMNRAKANYQEWCDSWDIANPSNPWPGNVRFFEVSVHDAINHVRTPLDAVSEQRVNLLLFVEQLSLSLCQPVDMLVSVMIFSLKSQYLFPGLLTNSPLNQNHLSVITCQHQFNC